MERSRVINGFTKQENGYFTNDKYPFIRFTLDYKEDLFCFEILQRPYFFNLLGFKTWETSIDTNCFLTGLGFSNHLLKQ